MTDVATLGLAVDSSQVERGKIALDQLANSATRAEAAANGVSSTTKNAGAAAANANFQWETSAETIARLGIKTKGTAGAVNAATVAVKAQAAEVQVAGKRVEVAGQRAEVAARGFSAFGAAMGLASRIVGRFVLNALTVGIGVLIAELAKLVDWAGLASRALNWLADGIGTIAPYAVLAAAGLALIYAPAVIGGLITAATSVGTISAAVWGLATALYATVGLPVLLVAGFVAMVAAAVIFHDELTNILGVDIVEAAKTGVNYIIGSFVAAYHDVEFLWKNFPDIIEAAAIGAVNAVIRSINDMIQVAAHGIDWLIEKANKIPGLNISKIGDASPIKEMNNPAAGRAAKANGLEETRVKGDLSHDYLGDFGGAIAKGASAASGKLKELSKWLTTVDDQASGKKGRHGKTGEQKFSDIITGANNKLAALKAEQAGLGLTADAAARLKYETELLNEANTKGITLTAAQRAQLIGLADQMAEVEVATKRAKEMQNAFAEAGRGIGGVLDGLISGTMSWKEALKAVIPIILKLLNDMNLAQGGKGIFGGGFVQSLIGGLLGAGFADGGYTGNGAANRAAGIVHGGEYVFSKRATDRIGVGNLEAMHRGARGYSAGGHVSANQNTPASTNQNQPQQVHVTVGVAVDKDGSIKAFVQDVSQRTAAGVVQAAFPHIVKASVGAVQKNMRDRPNFSRAG